MTTNQTFSKIWIIIVVIISLGGGILAYQYYQTTREIEKLEEMSEGIVKNNKLTLGELKNAEYYIPSYRETVQLENGSYFRPWSPGSATGLEVKLFDDKIAFGDLNGDGKEDAAVIVYSSGGGSGSFRDLAIVINQADESLSPAPQFLGDRVKINSITVQSGIITLDMIIHGEGDAMCCPSLEKTFKYELFENQLIEITEDETTDWETYRNEEYGFEIKYPENFGANVWKPLFWPPTTTVVPLNEDPVKKGCPDFPVGIQGATENEVRINNIDYTFYRGSEGAMGSSYTNYCYVAPKGQNYYIVYFVIRSATGCGNNCGTYCGTQYEAECKNLDRAKDIEKPIEKIISTFRFVE